MAKGLRSGLELAVEDLGLVQEKRPQRRKIAFSLSVEEKQTNGKNGVNGPSAQLLVTRGLKSGLELAVEDLGHVWERAQRQKIAWRQSVQVDL